MRTLIDELKELVESEVFVSDDGWANDDEGNRWFVGAGWSGGTHSGDNARRLAKLAGQESEVLTKARTDPMVQKTRQDILNDVLRVAPNDFLSSVRIGMLKWGRPTPKQMEVVKKLLKKYGPDVVTAFETGRGYKAGSIAPKAQVVAVSGAGAKTVSPSNSAERAGVLRAAVAKQGDSFLEKQLAALQGDDGWLGSVDGEVLKKIRHELYKRGMKKEADMFRTESTRGSRPVVVEEGGAAEFAKVVLKQLPDTDAAGLRMAMPLLKKMSADGWSVADAVKFLGWMEDFNPEAEEDKAVRMMNQVARKYPSLQSGMGESVLLKPQPRLTEDILKLRLLMVQSRVMREEKAKKSYPPVDLSPLVSYLEKSDKELEKVQDKVGRALEARAKAGDDTAGMLKDALEQTRELMLDLLKMTDEFEET